MFKEFFFLFLDKWINYCALIQKAASIFFMKSHLFFVNWMLEKLTFLIYYSAIEKLSEYSWVFVVFKSEFLKIYYLSLEIFNNLIFLSVHLFGLLFFSNLPYVLHFFQNSSHFSAFHQLVESSVVFFNIWQFLPCLIKLVAQDIKIRYQITLITHQE